ncbi:anaphase-promoting complex subunit 5 [Diorhabda sublineata]|uniref:anaphase-promoting complex subunit 5 n=1 Tax=Diorhabda sublineata TaxID=1163346 RepID=UPI0024E1969C|nr:anaphase-promoting complex subunit 5 [Diorhabda sublineata]
MSSKEITSSNSKIILEMITPHRLTVSILIRNFCLYRDHEKFKEMDDQVLMCKYRRDFCVLILRLLQSPDLPLLELKNLLNSKKYVIPDSLMESFDQTLATLNEEGIGNLLDIVDSLVKIMSRSEDHPNSTSVIAKTSIAGYYIRRFIVYFEKLTFSEVVKVFEDFQAYYEEIQKCTNFLNPDDENTDSWSSTREQWSRRQAELFIATQAALLSNNEGKALPPPELQNRISNILKSNPDLSGAHFLAYLNYLRVDEYCGAIESLLHCFDRNVDPDVKCYNDEKSKRHRFAALNLAILQYHFGHTEEALASLKEAIQVSQEANDNICLQHALSWLYRLTNVNEDKLIIHCILKSSELSLSYTASLGLQTFGQYGCLHTGKTYAIFETLAKSDMINCQHNYKDLISNNYSMKSSLWQLYGKTEMSSLWSQLLLYQNMDSLSPGKAFYGEGYCLAVCNIANHLLVEGEYGLVNCVLNFAKKRFPHQPQSNVWMLCENIFVFTRSLHHEKFAEAESAAQKIMVMDKWEGYLRLAEVFFYKRDYVEADKCIEMLLNQYENDNTYKFSDRYYYVRAKIIKMEIQFATSYPDSIPSGIITVLNNCLIESQTSQLDYQTALIHLVLANCMLHVGLTTQALGVLDKCLVQILGHGGCYDRARATLLYAKCLIADSSRLSNEERNKVIMRCAHMLEKVKDEFGKVEAKYRVKDVLFLQSQLYHWLNMKTERNKCALEYRLLDEEHTTKNIYSLVKYI